MDLLSNLSLGLHMALAWPQLLAAVAGSLLGLLTGVLHRLRPVTMIALLLPLVPMLDTGVALILLVGIHCGARYGAAAAMLMTQPAEPGVFGVSPLAAQAHALTIQGRGAAMLRLGAVAGFVAACGGLLLIVLLAPPLTELAFRFGAAEVFSLMVLGLVGSAALAGGSLVGSLGMAVLGLLLTQIGRVPQSDLLKQGIGVIPLAIGLFAAGEVIINLGRAAQARRERIVPELVAGRWPTRSDLREAWTAVLRGTLTGSVLGLLPGASTMLAAVSSYGLERRAAAGPVAGAMGPEAARHAAVQTTLLPVLTLGIPSSATTALLVAAMTIKGLQAGPLLMTGQPSLFWGLIASIWIGNVVLLAVGLSLAGVWDRLLTISYRRFAVPVLLLCCFGVYLGGGERAIYLTAVAALMGYFFHKLRAQVAPLLLGFILGPMMEENLRRALQLADGEWSVFASRPLSLGLLMTALLLLVLVLLPKIRSRRQTVFREEG